MFLIAIGIIAATPYKLQTLNKNVNNLPPNSDLLAKL